MDIAVVNGKIAEIGKDLPAGKSQVISSKNLHVSVGWLDIGTHIGEPGLEHRETTKSLCSAALAGGYTDLAPFATSVPSIQTKAQVTAIVNDAAVHGVSLHPIGALSVDRKGENIAEYLDMAAAGVTAYSDGLRAVQKSGLLLRALQYSKASKALVIHHPTDHTLDNDAQIHEGDVSIKMGMKGSPSMAEHVMVDRDISLQQYTDARLCLYGISSKDSVDRIKKAKAKTTDIYSTVPYLNLLLTDTDLLDFDTNLKVSPVLRSTADRSALVRAVKAGIIDCLVSNHVPLEPEAKQVEFPYAKTGATGLETLYAAVNTNLGDQLPLIDLITILTVNSRKMLGTPIPALIKDAPAKLTCWDPTIEWTYDGSSRKSRSQNNPFLDKLLVGRVVACINGDKAYTL